MANKLKISFCLTGHASNRVPELKILHNNRLVKSFAVDGVDQWIDVLIDANSTNCLAIDFYNKEPQNTIVEQGQIVDDMFVELKAVRIDDILLQSWFINDGYYYPRYFEDFKKNFPDSLDKIKSQRIWHFPGTYQFESFPENIWHWYHMQRTSRIELQNMDKDLHRWEKFVGSAERYQDVVDRIKKLIHET